MQKRIKIFFGQKLSSNVISLIKELDEKGYIEGDTIVYNDSEESIVTSLFDKYHIPATNNRE